MTCLPDGWRLANARGGGLYAEVCVGDRVELSFAPVQPDAEGRRTPERLWVRVLETERLAGRRFVGELLRRPRRVPFECGARVSFGMRHVSDWRRRGEVTPLELIAQWWSTRTHQRPG